MLHHRQIQGVNSTMQVSKGGSCSVSHSPNQSNEDFDEFSRKLQFTYCNPVGVRQSTHLGGTNTAPLCKQRVGASLGLTPLRRAHVNHLRNLTGLLILKARHCMLIACLPGRNAFLIISCLYRCLMVALLQTGFGNIRNNYPR